MTKQTKKDTNKVVTKSVIAPEKKKAYGKSQSCGDNIAQKLTEFTKSYGDGAIAQVCEWNGINPERWSHLNVGMQRMNLGNVLRGRVKRGEEIDIRV